MISGLDDVAYYVTVIVATVVEIYMIHTLYETDKPVAACAAIWGFFGALFLGSTMIIAAKTGISEIVISFFTSIVMLAAFRILFKGVTIEELTFSFVFISNVIYLIIVFARYFVCLFKNDITSGSATYLYLIVFLVVIGFFTVSFGLDLHYTILRSLSAYDEKFFNLLGFALANYITLLFSSRLWEHWNYPGNYTICCVLLVIGIEVLGYSLVFTALTSHADKVIQQKEAQLDKEQLAAVKKYYDGLVENVQAMREHNHNMKYIVNTLAALNQNKNYEEMDAFIKALEADIPESTPVWSRIAEIDAVLSDFTEKCAKEKIKFDCEFSLPKETGVNPLHMCIILGNVLQNAYEACLYLDNPKDRKINLVCFMAHDKIVLSCENTFDGVLLQDEEGCLISRKADTEMHSIGLASIQSTAEKYHGNSTWEVRGKRFKVIVLLIPGVEEDQSIPAVRH